MSIEKFRQKTYYELLGVARNANVAEIEKAFLDLSRIYDPASDFFAELINDPPKPKDIEIFDLIKLAYSVLKDPNKRKDYDQDLPNKSGAEVHLEELEKDKHHKNIYLWVAVFTIICLLFANLMH